MNVKFENTTILYDQYKDTCIHNREMVKKRGKLFVAAGLVELLNLALLLFPETILHGLSDYAISQFQTNIQLSISLLQSAVWISILYIVIQYFQVNTNIERRYGYIGKLESELAELMETPLMKRESESYSNSYPLLLNIADSLYKWVFPTLFALINLFKIKSEIKNQGFNGSVILDLLLFLLIDSIVVIYMWSIFSLCLQEKKEKKTET